MFKRVTYASDVYFSLLFILGLAVLVSADNEDAHLNRILRDVGWIDLGSTARED